MTFFWEDSMDPTSKIHEMHAVVSGKVQGVGFRTQTCQYARLLGLVGTVRNLENGNVEILAQGPKKDLETLMQRLTNDSGPGEIKESIVECRPVKMFHKDFKVLTSGES
jgi:acylphosphatase